MPVYPALAIAAAAAVVALERSVFRSGLFRQPAYWVAMAIAYGFMVPVDGWLTKLSAPIVLYNEEENSGIRFPWDIPVEDYLFGFALIVLTMLLWERAGRGDAAGEPSRGTGTPLIRRR